MLFHANTFSIYLGLGRKRERDIILNQDAEWQAPLLHLAQVSTRPFSSRSLLHVYSPKFAATCPDWTNEWILRQTVHGYRGTMRNLNLWIWRRGYSGISSAAYFDSVCRTDFEFIAPPGLSDVTSAYSAGETRKAYPTKVRHELKKWRIVLLYIRPSASWPA